MDIAIHNSQFSYHIGGTERLIYYQIKNLIEFKDVRITLITSKNKNNSFLYKEIKSIKSKRFKIIELDVYPYLNPYNANNPFRWHLESVHFGLASQKIYQKYKFDFVVTHFSTDSLYIPLNQKNVLHLHGVPREYSEIGEISTMRPNLFLAVSKYVKEGWIYIYPVLANLNIDVVYPGIENSKFFSKNFKKSIDIIYVGRFISIKGINNLIEAVSMINTPLHICLIGDGPDKEIISETIQRMCSQHQIDLISYVDDEKLIELYNSSKIAVFPSYAKEGVLLTMLEAASCGCAIITCRACSMPEFIKDRENGVLCEPKNSHDLLSKIKLLLNDDLLRKNIGKNAQKSINREWGNKDRIRELYNIYCKFGGNNG